MKRKILASILVIAFVFGCITPIASAAEIENSEINNSTLNRVYSEVLTGNITNASDVIAVALAQSTTVATSPYTRDSSAYHDTPLTITQELSSTTDSRGNTTKEIATTALVLVNSNNELITTAYAYYEDSASSTGGSNTYGVYAVHTLYVQIRTDSENLLELDPHIRAKYATTSIQSASTLPTSLSHRFEVDTDNFNTGTLRYPDSIVYSYPSVGTTYRYTPSVSNTWYQVTGTQRAMRSFAIFTVDGSTFEIWAGYSLS